MKKALRLVCVLLGTSITPWIITSENIVDQQQISGGELSFRQVKLAKMQSILESAGSSILEAQEKFSAQVYKKLTDGMGNYSVQAAADFNNFLSQAMRSFTGALSVTQQSCISDYYEFLELNNKSKNPKKVSPAERDFMQSLDHLCQEATLRAQAFILDITSGSAQAQLTDQLEDGLREAKELAQKDYQAQREAHAKSLDEATWRNIQKFGQTVLQEFGVRFEKKVKEEVGIAAKKLVVEVGGKAVGIAAGAAIGKVKVINAQTQKQLAHLSEKLATESITKLFDDHKDMAQKALKIAIKTAGPVLHTSGIAVQPGTGLCPQEQQFLKMRDAIVAKTLKEEFGISSALRVGMCCSGGGVRAMVGTLGFLQAAAESKVLNVTTYLVGLSGSTWIIAPWSYLYLNRKLNPDLATSLEQMRESFKATLSDRSAMLATPTGAYIPIRIGQDVMSDFAYSMAARFAFDQLFSAINVYGPLVSKFALDLAQDKRLSAAWSSCALNASQGHIPLPLCSSIFNGTPQSTTIQYEWFETGPFQAGSAALAGYVPIQYLGSTFKDGKLVKGLVCPEYPLSFYIGLYGSAFSLTASDIIVKGITNPSFTVAGAEIQVPVDAWVKDIIEQNFGAKAGVMRPEKIHAQFANFSEGMLASVLQNETSFGMCDAGIDFNIPTPLLFDRPERSVDVVFMYDSNNVDFQTLQDMTAYFKRKKIPAPNFAAYSQATLRANPMTVFNDPRLKTYDKSMATFLYFPTNVSTSKLPYTTLNFMYSEQQVDDLADKVYNRFASQVPEIKEIFKLVAQKRNGA